MKQFSTQLPSSRRKKTNDLNQTMLVPQGYQAIDPNDPLDIYRTAVLKQTEKHYAAESKSVPKSSKTTRGGSTPAQKEEQYYRTPAGISPPAAQPRKQPDHTPAPAPSVKIHKALNSQNPSFVQSKNPSQASTTENVNTGGTGNNKKIVSQDKTFKT